MLYLSSCLVRRHPQIAAFLFCLGLIYPPCAGWGPAAQAQPESAPINLEATPTPAAQTGKEKEEADLELSAVLGYCDYQPALKSDTWYPLWITIKPLHSDLKGEIFCQQPDNPLRTRIPLEIAKGTTKRLMTYYRLREGLMATLEITVDARPLKSKEMLPLPLRIAEKQDHHILVFSEEQGTFSFLKRQSESNDPNNTLRIPQTIVFEGRIDQLPTEPLALAGIDSIVINTPEIRALSVEQWHAIEQWVELGGRLLLGTGSMQPFLEQSVVKLPQDLSAGTPQPGIIGMGADEMRVSPLAGTWDTIHTGTPEAPALASQRVGAGLITLASVSLDPTALAYFRALPDSWRLWPAILLRENADALTAGIGLQAQNYIPVALQLPFTVNLAGVGWVMAYLGLYILLALPLNWLFWILLKRREWAWPSMIAIALGFAWYGYSSGLESQAKGLHVHELALIKRPKASASAYYESYATVFADRRTRTPLTAAPGVFPANISQDTDAMNYRQPEMYAASPLEIQFGTSVDLENFFIYAFSARNLRGEGVIQPEGAIELLADGTIKNGLPWTFTRWGWVAGDQAYLGSEPLLAGTQAQQPGTRKPYPELTALLVSGTLEEFNAGTVMTANQQARFDMNSSYFSGSNMPDLRLGKGLGANCFIGIAEIPLNPLLDKLDVARRINRVIYVQALDPAKQTVPARQTGRISLNRAEDPMNRMAKYSDQLWFPARPFAIKAYPPLAEGGPVPRSMTLALSIANAPQADKDFEKDGQKYRVIGCGAQVFNFRTGVNEATGLLDNGKIELNPLIDYIDPSDSSVQIWLEGTPKDLKLAKVREDSTLETVTDGRPWAGGEAVDPMRPWQYDESYAKFLQIVSYEFTFDPPQTGGTQTTSPETEQKVSL